MVRSSGLLGPQILKPPAVQSIPDAMLNLLRCPISSESLRLATEAEIQASEHVGGSTCKQGLVSRGGSYFYRVQEGIPLLIPEAAIDLSATKSTLAIEKEAANLRHSAR